MKMHKWIPDIVCTKDEINLMLKFVLSELIADPESDSTAAIAGDTIVVGTVNSDDGSPIVFECTIRRSNLTVEESKPFMMPMAVNEGDPS